MSNKVKIMERIHEKAAQVSQYREEMASCINLLEAAQQAAKDEHYGNIKKAYRKVSKSQEELINMVKSNVDLFDKPKTQIIDGVRFGLRKQKGKTVWADDDSLIQAIKNLVKKGELDEDVQQQLIKVSEKPVASALEKLDVKQLKKLGVTIEEATDAVVINSVDSEINKALDAMLKEMSIITLDEQAQTEQ